MWETTTVHSFLLALQVKELMKELLYGKRHAGNEYEIPPFFNPGLFSREQLLWMLLVTIPNTFNNSSYMFLSKPFVVH